MTLKKLAELAHVSVSTVSKAFSGSREVSDETRQMIFDTAKANGCFDKYYKEPYEKKLIAVICNEFISRFYADFIGILGELAAERNATILSACTYFSKEKLRELVEYFAVYAKADAVIIIGAPDESLMNYSVPVIFINHNESMFMNTISEAVRYLKSMGHERIGFAGERYTEPKRRNVIKALKAENLEVDEGVIFTDHTARFEKAGYNALSYMKKSGRLPTAVIAGYDSIALGVMKKALEMGLRLPQDLSVIGMNNIPEAAYLPVALTTIGINKKEVCEKALDLLYTKFASPAAVIPICVSASASLIIRDSVGRRDA